MLKKLGLYSLLLLCITAFAWAGTNAARKGVFTKDNSASTERFVMPPSNLPPVGSRHPGSLDEVIISDNFDSDTPGALPEGWTQVDVDGGSCGQFGRQSTWQVYDYSAVAGAPHSGSNVLMNHYNDNALANNDWLILPLQNLGAPITLSYWVASQDPLYLESYEIKVSTTGTLPANFTHLVQSFTNVPTTWTQHTHDLSAYAGAPFYIAIHYNSVDKFVIKVDDMLLEGVPAASASLSGSVTNETTHAAIPGVLVELQGTALSTTTNAEGNYMFNIVPPDTYSVVFSHPLYDPLTINDVVAVLAETTVVDAALHPLPLEFNDFASIAAPVAIVDQDTAFMTLDADLDVVIFDLDVTINITHTYDSDLTVWLQSPGGQRIELFTAIGGSGDNFTNTRFDDEATAPISSGAAPFTGTFRPSGSLGDLDNFSAQGTWTLVVYDGFAQDNGTIDGFTLHVTSETGDPISGSNHTTLPSAFTFAGNYPNPFNAITQFSFDLARQSRVELKLYNTLGQEVAVVANHTFEAGAHTVSFDATELTSGLYFARMSAAGVSETRKVILMK